MLNLIYKQKQKALHQGNNQLHFGQFICISKEKNHDYYQSSDAYKAVN